METLIIALVLFLILISGKDLKVIAMNECLNSLKIHTLNPNIQRDGNRW